MTDVQFIPLMYLGAKHMVTGYDPLLFLAGVILTERLITAISYWPAQQNAMPRAFPLPVSVQ